MFFVVIGLESILNLMYNKEIIKGGTQWKLSTKY